MWRGADQNFLYPLIPSGFVVSVRSGQEAEHDKTSFSYPFLPSDGLV
jgi:hypothetical protein